MLTGLRFIHAASRCGYDAGRLIWCLLISNSRPTIEGWKARTAGRRAIGACCHDAARDEGWPLDKSWARFDNVNP